jgi:hypothetical protein
MRKYVITFIHKAILGGFPMAFGDPISYQEMELEGYLTKRILTNWLKIMVKQINVF